MITKYIGQPSEQFFAETGTPSKIKWLPISYYNPKRGELVNGEEQLRVIFVDLPEGIPLYSVIIQRGSPTVEQNPSFWLPEGLDFSSTEADFRERFGEPIKTGGDTEDFLGYIDPWAIFDIGGDVKLHISIADGVVDYITYISKRIDEMV